MQGAWAERLAPLTLASHTSRTPSRLFTDALRAQASRLTGVIRAANSTPASGDVGKAAPSHIRARSTARSRKDDQSPAVDSRPGRGVAAVIAVRPQAQGNASQHSVRQNQVWRIERRLRVHEASCRQPWTKEVRDRGCDSTSYQVPGARDQPQDDADGVSLARYGRLDHRRASPTMYACVRVVTACGRAELRRRPIKHTALGDACQCRPRDDTCGRASAP